MRQKRGTEEGAFTCIWVLSRLFHPRDWLFSGLLPGCGRIKKERYVRNSFAERRMRSICRESAGGCRRRQGIIRPCCISFILLRRSACSTRKTGRSCGTELRMRRISSLSVWVWEAYPFRFIWKFRRQGIGMREIRWCLSCGGRRRNSGI